MRLKNLTIKGFKSFADETVINFNENLIGIVGPNGSGKSNIVDSIRWVLGEQKTSELRLDSMSDVLFNGTKSRKEGRVARATLTFDNTKNILPTDYNEVSISRILYRNGNSEYRLNDVICRKKDIQSLFLDSGIGSNSYAIISLNMVEDILHDKGGSRRYMIEQAAGISKYKVRKKETLSKLRSTAEDLERVNDLLFEIQKNMSSFERQAKRTEKYNKLKEEYRELSINMAKRQVKEISDRLKQLRDSKAKEQDQKLTIESDLKNTEAKVEKLKLAILEAEKSLNQDQQNYNQLIERLGSKENQKNLVNQRIITAKDRLSEGASSLESLTTSEENAKQQLTKAESQKTNAQQQLDQYQKTVDEINATLASSQTIYTELREQEQNIKDKVAATQQERSITERMIESLSTKMSMHKNDIERLEERKKTMLSERSGKSTRQAELSTLVSDHEAKEEQLTKSIDDLEAHALVMDEQITASRAEKNKVEVSVSSLGQRIKFLQNVIEKNEGASEAAKYIMSTEKDVTLFSDVVVVDDQELVPIVELFFEAYLGHLIVDTEQRAMAIHSLVRDAQKGKIKIFALDGIPAISQESAAPKGCRPLIDVLTYDSAHERLVKYLAQDVYICEGAITDIDLKALRPSTTILSAGRYMIYTAGELYGGSNTLFEGVQLGRKKILDGLLEQKEKASKDVEAHQVKVSQLQKDKQSIIAKVQYAKQDKKEVVRELNMHRQALYSINSQLASHDENVAQIDQQIAQKTEAIQVTDTELKAKNTQLESINSMKLGNLSDDELTQKISTIYEQISTQRTERDTQLQQLYQAQNQKQIAQKEYEYHQSTLKSISDRRAGIASEATALEQRVQEDTVTLESVTSELKTLYTQRDELQKKLSGYEDTYYKDKGVIFEKEKEVSGLRSQLHQKESMINVINDKLAQQQFDLKALHDRVEIEFGQRIQDVEIDEQYIDGDIHQLQLHKEKLQHKIRAFGDINPMAIEAYNEIKERHEHISKEQNDILEAKQSLEETIEEIETAASAQFNESLQQIKVNFKKVFQGLFSEDDDCDIVLLDTDDPLEAKIEIVAKPKGKKPKSISMLSGGEKTLTAASFLFALYLLKPAPFCIFDEVDAPLDDVNVLKFNKIIRQFSEDSQFIIITHNKLTMAEVDVLYGVFLREQGVSGVSAVDFREFDEAELEAIS